MTAPFTREPNKGSKLYLSIACATAGFQHTVQIFTNTVEVAVYLIIGNSYNRKSVLFKKFCPFGVIFNSFILVVLRAVKFNYQVCFCTTEINNIAAYYFLTEESYILVSQIIIPQVPFFLGHIFAKHLCVFNKIFVMIILHL